MAASIYADALNWLHRALGADAEFRDGQWEAIQTLVEDRKRVLVVQRTGWGKSLVYFLATRLLRDQGEGPTVLISPLLSLMRNQVQAANTFGLRAVTVNSTNADEHAEIEAQLDRDEIDILLISPERLANDHFQSQVWSSLRHTVGMLVVDEVHCISDWGHDFRPNYRRIMATLDALPRQLPIIGTTATANSRVIEDVSDILGSNITILRGSLTRQSLSLYAFPTALSAADRLALLAEMLRKMQGSGIIYCMTTHDCQLVAGWLQSQGLKVNAYYADVESEEGADRVKLEQQLLNNELKALVASVALGMGFDKPDLHFVIHYQYPGSIISYYQQIGRAGRGIDHAQIILMHGQEDVEIQRYFIDSAFPKPEHIAQTLDALAQADRLTMNELNRYVNVRRSTMEKILTHLEVDKIVEKAERGYRLIAPDRTPDYERWNRVTAQRYRELEQIQAYIRHDGCLMQFIAAALDDDSAQAPCGRCQNCLNKQGGMRNRLPAPELVEAASAYLRQGKPIPIEPRAMWPSGLPSVKGKLKSTNWQGVALCEYYDHGWGDVIRAARQSDSSLPDAVIKASAALLRADWRSLDTPPTWVTVVPSLRRPRMLPDFARRLADHLGLPFHAAIHKVTERPEQRTMQNSYQQANNVIEAFGVDNDLPADPVLLIDDLLDSGWTLTVIGVLLRKMGCAGVYPFALAKGIGRGDG
ncbi:MAG: RecQ family ATP-dependent DNA helicase [Anaerolineae bacterium]|nr:RecQ family ATP-dependent DNA helicase [Anaerolineae bacterium]